ncbi:hypothetical protein [Moraxella oblonga]|uniref:hypothetical protein n=1 Tax=Moraxella oblonga TaxID=200413 RepID=UPI00082D15F4|nr:hypothetical protein [Moraxella oblonga]
MVSKAQFFKEYQSSDEDDKYDVLSYFYYHSGLVVDNEIFEFLNKELDNHKNLDEFLVVEIIKVITKYSDNFYNENTRDKVFNVFLESEEELVWQHALLCLEFETFTPNQIQLLKNKLNEVDENTQAIIQDILTRQTP